MHQEQKSQLVIDKEGGLRRLGGDLELYNELIDLFMDTSVDQIEQLKLAVKNNEADDIRKVAHSIKGAAANLGITLVQQIAFELEKIGYDKNLSEAEDSLNRLMYELERVKEYVRH
jgi:HPt (histidine-containing phosphotransfer) domain-containing protein